MTFPRLPKPPWYEPLERKMSSVEHLSDFILVVVIVIAIVLLVRGDKVMKSAGAVYLISP